MRSKARHRSEEAEFLTVDDIEKRIGSKGWSGDELVYAVERARNALFPLPMPRRLPTRLRRKRRRDLRRLLKVEDGALAVLLVLWERLRRTGLEVRPLPEPLRDERSADGELLFLVSRITEILADRVVVAPTAGGDKGSDAPVVRMPRTVPPLLHALRSDLRWAMPRITRGMGRSIPAAWPDALRHLVDLIEDSHRVGKTLKRKRVFYVAEWAKRRNPDLPGIDSIRAMIARANTR